MFLQEPFSSDPPIAAVRSGVGSDAPAEIAQQTKRPAKCHEASVFDTLIPE